MALCDFLIKGAEFLDVSSGETKMVELAIRNGLMADPNSIVNPKIIDASGLHVMFGLWDCHAHPGGLMYDPSAQGYFEGPAEWAVRAGANLLDAALMGVTGIRTVAEANRIDLAWASGFATGIYSGPRMKCSGAGLRTTGGHGTAFPRRPMEVQWEWAVDGADQMRTAARTLIEQGVDWIKLMITGGLYSEHETVEDSQFTDEELAAVMEVANNRGVPVAAHCGGARIAERFAELGGRSIEHGYALDERSADALAKAGTWLVPTIGVTHDVEMMEADGWPKHAKDRAIVAAKTHSDALNSCVEAGVKIATGADLNPIGPRLHAELKMMEKAGMSRLQVLHSASVGGRELNGLGDNSTPIFGTIADLIFLDGNPLDDLSILAKPRAVMTFGRFISGFDQGGN